MVQDYAIKQPSDSQYNLTYAFKAIKNNMDKKKFLAWLVKS